MRTWSVVAEMVASHGRCALVTVMEIRGSAPREPGARMVIAPDGGFRGTIGGGELEWQAIGAARDALSRDTPTATLDRLTLGPDLGQCCGGSVRLLTEVLDRERLDEVRALAAREAAGPFVTRGRIGPRRVERVVTGGAAFGALDPEETSRPTGSAASADTARGALDPEETTRPLRHPTIVDSSFGAGAAGASRGERRRGGTTDRGVVHPRLPVVLETDDLAVELFCDLRRPVWLFGAGHVGRALMLALAPLPFDVTWVDERAGAFPAALPANVRPLRSDDPAQVLARVPDGALIVVMTHSHSRDLSIVHAALAAGRFGYVGLIGSASKRARFTRRLRDAGVAEARIAALVCPIGRCGIRSKHPAAIAAGVAAQLLERDDVLGASAAPVRSAVTGGRR